MAGTLTLWLDAPTARGLRLGDASADHPLAKLARSGRLESGVAMSRALCNLLCPDAASLAQGLARAAHLPATWCDAPDLCLVSPVHLEARMEHLVLAADLTDAFATPALKTLADALNAHFAAEQFCVAAGHLLARAEGIRAAPLPDLDTVFGQSLAQHWPGFDARSRPLARWLNAIQMFLYERDPEALLNGLWPWGGVAEPAPPPAPNLDSIPPFTAVYADHPLVKTLAASRGIPCHPSASLDIPSEGQVLAIVANAMLLEALAHLRSALRWGKLRHCHLLSPELCTHLRPWQAWWR